MESDPKRETAFSMRPYCGEDFTICGICRTFFGDTEYYVFVSPGEQVFVTCSPSLVLEAELARNLVYEKNCHVEARLVKEGGEYHLRLFATPSKTNEKEEIKNDE